MSIYGVDSPSMNSPIRFGEEIEDAEYLVVNEIFDPADEGLILRRLEISK